VACYSSENQCQPELSGVETPLEWKIQILR
jgi:hypothetical protein